MKHLLKRDSRAKVSANSSLPIAIIKTATSTSISSVIVNKCIFQDSHMKTMHQTPLTICHSLFPTLPGEWLRVIITKTITYPTINLSYDSCVYFLNSTSGSNFAFGVITKLDAKPIQFSQTMVSQTVV